jgi:hypothetical protein
VDALQDVGREVGAQVEVMVEGADVLVAFVRDDEMVLQHCFIIISSLSSSNKILIID